ncbi:hypothetical protein Y1Q_0018180 [Alligator mississippiensis]|uniref:Microtubule-actin cross-linking factor 1 n=1 Tax=Alligator mississippiensis TaxID=8496 RepID=A0A151P1K9_ALLMI|nr:hypothetical protein Y1Q_0018180 [Alligator mississippiensis]
MSPPGQWAPSEPAWLRVAWVAGLALSSVAVWILFLLGSLRGRPPAQARAPLTTGKQLGPGKSLPSSERKKRKGTKPSSVPPRATRVQPHKKPRGTSLRGAARTQELMSGSRRERSRMAEESSSGSSGSPSPGDTLPWNLAKHQRSKRNKASAGNGTVLDPAERAVIRIAVWLRFGQT